MAGHGAPENSVVDATGLSLGVVATTWHGEVVSQLVQRSRDAAAECHVTDVQLAQVAGAVEIPVVAQAMARKYDAVVALGVVVRGATAHFDYVCQSVTMGLTTVALQESTPVAHGVLTVNSDAEAIDRAGYRGSSEDKGWAATTAALGAALVLRQLE